MSGRLLRWLMSLAHRPTRPGEARVTIIRHHRVFAPGTSPLYRLGVDADVFERQLVLLARLGHEPVTVSEALERGRAGEPGHWIALSFDDGYADNVEVALPIMQRHGARGSFFVTSRLTSERRAPWWDVVAHALEHAGVESAEWHVAGERLSLDTRSEALRRRTLQTVLPLFRKPVAERAARLESLREALRVVADVPCELATWEQLEQLRDAGMEIGAHTLHHPHLSVLDREAQREEIAGSIDEIRERLGVASRGLAYPEGDYDAATLEVVSELGLAWAVTTRGGDNGPNAPVYELRRRGLSEGACLAPGRRFSDRLATAELHGAFDDLRGLEAAS